MLHLVLNGVGYRASILKKNNISFINIKLGYSHPCFVPIPASLSVSIIDTVNILIRPSVTNNSNNSTELLESFSALIQSISPINVYKGKGIMPINTQIKLKEPRKKSTAK